mgnify:CR=1 FL=1
MDISIVLASRERTVLLNNMLKSIQDTVSDKNRIEVLVGIDDDDVQTKKAVIVMRRKYSFVKFYSRQRSGMLNRDYLNWLSMDHSKGKYIIISNDDTEFKTPGWDDIICRKMEAYLADKPDRIAYGFMSDALLNRQGLDYCCFPLVTIEGARTLGFAIPSEYPAWSADVALWQIYKAAGRTCDLSEVMIEHISIHSGKRHRDHISHHVERLSATVEVKLPTEEYIQKLRSGFTRRDMTLLEEVVDCYNQVMAYHQRINYDTKLDTIWTNNMSDIGSIVSRSNSAEELIDNVDQTFMYSINFPPENACGSGVWNNGNDMPHIRQKQIEWLLAKQKQDGLNIFEMDESIQESRFVHSRNKTVRNGRTLTGNFLRTLSVAHRLFRQIDKNNINHIIELGGGAGHQARTFALLLPNCKYTIVDLPETLIFSYTYMKLNFPDKKSLYVTSTEDIKKIDEYDYVFVPSVFSPNLGSRNYDLFVNTASMGEMRNETIYQWMNFIQNQIKVTYLYTLNRFLNVVDTTLANFRTSENECSTCYDHKWDIISWELEPIHTRCPYIDTLHSRYLEIIASRPTQVPTDLVKKSQELLQDALDEDWNRLEGVYGIGLMQYRLNVLVNDMTMTGTLFKLWESIRLDQTAKNVETMVRYLPRLIVNHQFEEQYYYEGLLNRLR